MKKFVIVLTAFFLLFAPVFVYAKTTSKTVSSKKTSVTKSKTTKKKVTVKRRILTKKSNDPDIVTSRTVKGMPVGYMEMLVEARDKYLKAASLAKKHRSSEELKAAEEEYNDALMQANSLLTPANADTGRQVSVTATVP